MAIPKVTRVLLGENICSKATFDELWHGTAIALFAAVAIIFFPIFIYLSYLAERQALLWILVSFWFTSIFIYLFMLKSTSVKMAAKISSFVCGLLFFYLLTTGAAENTGLFWCYVVMPVLYQMLGPWQGALANGILVLGSAIVFYVPSLELLKADYSPTQMSRFVFSYLVLSTLGFVHEYARSQANMRLNELKEQFRKASQRDSLTKLGNRREAKNRLKIVERLAVDPDYQCGLILCDVDFFKKINDGFGHDCGDYVLKRLAKLLDASTRNDDLVVRWGGEEFLIILPSTNRHQSILVCKKIQQCLVQENFHYQDHKINVSLSFGVSYINHHQNANQALISADHDLYQAKHQGRNCIVADGEVF